MHSPSTPENQPGRHAPNRLIAQTSPYLLQHAHNPVDWWPWGPEAFAEARRRDVPILLSVGYSTCYWCHVMERESFENEPVGRLMSDRLVCIKLDREERPDVDDVYMTALQITTGRGGWPMNVFLEPASLKPFWCGTYFPPEPRMNMPAWSQVIERISDAWVNQRQSVIEQAEQVASAVAEHLSADAAPVAVGETQITEAVSQLLKMFDRVEGGFGAAPKFPQPANLDFLLTVRELASDDATKDAIDEAVRRTLNKMACGGMNDQIGGGFHRYSVDTRWLVPHFEKMLYDNAQLARVYARAATTYADDFYARVARRTLDYVLKEMTGTLGEFHTAQDAEVGGREGLNYLWTIEQLRLALRAPDAEFAAQVYGLSEGPNFRDPHHPDSLPANIPRLTDRPDRLAHSLSLSEPGFLSRLDAINGALYEAREARSQPRLDDKVLASWNGLMIGALAYSGRVLGQARFVYAAHRASEFIRREMWDGTRLRRSWRAGASGSDGVLEDYASITSSLLELYKSLNDLQRHADAASTLALAIRISDASHEQFADYSGRYFDTRADQTDVFVRASSASDGAVPSGSSMMLHALLELADVTGDRKFADRAICLLSAMSAAIAASPLGTVHATHALCRVMTEPSLRDASSLPHNQQHAQHRHGSPGDEKSSGTNGSILAMEVYAGVDRVALTADRPASLTLVLKVANGYHVIAAEPTAESADAPSLHPMRVGISGGTGVAAYADYPPGEEFGVPGLGSLLVYRGTLELVVALEQTGPVTGRPIVTLTYQACGDAECLLPAIVELDVAIDIE